jgi:methionine biosynthesis protein MetW
MINQLSKLYKSVDVENRRVILSLLEVAGNSARILDLGCNDGGFTLEMGKKVGTTSLFGVELVEEFVQQCLTQGIETHRADLNEPLPFNNASFDIIVANQVFEHLHNTDQFIKEINRVLKSDGYAIVSTPNLAAWHNIASLLLGWQPFVANLSDEINIGNPMWPSYKKKAAQGKYPVHRRIPTYRGLKELFEYYGFVIEKLLGIGYYPFPRAVARIMSRIDARHAVYLTMRVRK